jgi:hypothetical protein
VIGRVQERYGYTRNDAEREVKDFFDRRDEVATREEPSPHFAGRAQPSDVIGVETGGEQTHVGETTEDENNRRRDAEDEFATGSNRRRNRG